MPSKAFLADVVEMATSPREKANRSEASLSRLQVTVLE